MVHMMRTVGFGPSSTHHRPSASGRDLLVRIHAVAVNPLDLKMRGVPMPGGGARILGWDAAGVVVEAGAQATRFAPGDRVFHAGALDRDGANAEYHLVDERIVGRCPQSLGWAQAAALPLTGLTAMEALFERLEVDRPLAGAARAILIVGGAGGVGSIAIQLARQLTDLTVIATASRGASRDWALSMGAHHVIDHRTAMAPQIASLGLAAPGYVLSTTQSAAHMPDIAELIAPQGRIALIDDPVPFDQRPLKHKSVSLHWEFMFTRSMYATADMHRQGEWLDHLADMVDDGRIRSTMTEHLGALTTANLERAHARIASGEMCGKIVLDGVL